MKYVFLGALILAATLYVIAYGTVVRPPDDGIAHLRWATDPNPARTIQTGLFDDMFKDKLVDVVVDPGLGGDQTKLIVQCATGTGPDIIDVYSKAQMLSLVDAGILLDITDYAEEMGFSPDKTYPSLREGLVVDGRQYRFPCNVWANCVIYNKRILDDHGLPYPQDDWTWDDFIELGKQFNASESKSGDTHIYFANWASQQLFGELLFGAGGRFFSEDGLTSMINSEAGLFAMQFYYDLMYEHNVIPTSAQLASMSAQGGWGSGGLTLFSTGNAAMMIIGRWYIIQVPNYPEIEGCLGAALLPRVGDRPSAGQCDTRAAGINAKGANTMEALYFLQYLASPEYSGLIVKDGDALPPNPALARSGEDLINKAVPDPEFHQPFVDAIENARPIDMSPFIDALVVQRWLQEHIDKVENELMTPEDACNALAHEIRQQIRVNLERQPHLQAKFEEVTGKPYTPDWWRDHDVDAENGA